MTLDLNVLLSLNISTMTEFQQTPHSPERGETRTGVFNFEGLNPQEVAKLGVSLVYMEMREVENPRNPDMPPMGFLDEIFVNDFESFSASHPEQAEDVFHLVREDAAKEEEAAFLTAMLAPAIANNNYEFARDTLLDIAHGTHGGYGGLAIEEAERAIELLQDELPADQAADLASHDAAHDARRTY